MAICPEALSIVVLLAGTWCGPRAIFALLPVGWTLLGGAWTLEDRLAPELEGHDLRVTGVVCDLPGGVPGLQRFVWSVDTAGRDAGVPQRVYVSWYDAESPVRAGERWQLTVRLRRPRGLLNPGAFDFERWAFRRAIGAVGYVRASAGNRRLAPTAARCRLAGVRQRLADAVRSAMTDARAIGFALALTVGVRQALDDQTWTALRRTGTAHLMAISGLHIGLVAGLAFFGVRVGGRVLLRFGIRCRPLVWARAAAFAAAVGYSALAGFSVPTLRAMVMTCGVLAMTGVRRPIPPRVALALALYVVLWIEPFAILAPGFWLSFGAVLVLLLAGLGRRYDPDLRQTRAARLRRQLRGLLWAQGCLSIGLLPLTGLFFGEVSLIAPLANLVMVPLFGMLLVPTLLVGVIALLLAPSVAAPAIGLAEWLLARVAECLYWLNGWPGIAVSVPALHGPAIGFGIAGIVIVLWPRPLPVRFGMTAVLLAVTAFFARPAPAPDLRVVVMDVGQGLAVLLQTPAHAVLFDAGPRYRSGADAGRNVVLPVLRHFGVGRLERMIVSHADADHAGGAASVLAAWPRTNLLASAPLDGSAARFQRCRAGQVWQVGAITLRILHPDTPAPGGPWSENDASCVLLLRSPSAAVLLPGDIERRAEQHLVTRGVLSAVDLVIAPHHGSRSSSTPPFVAATRPAYVVFAAGYRNRWGFPAEAVRRRWGDTGACVLTTGDLGALVFEVRDGGRLRLVQRYRPDRSRAWNEAVTASGCRSGAPTN